MSTKKEELREIEIKDLLGLEELEGKFKFKLRDEIKDEVISDYQEIYEDGENELPPIVVFKRNDGKFLVADGKIRVEASKWANKNTIKAIIKDGSNEEIILEAINRNIVQGQSLTHKEKRRCVKKVLDLDWSKNKSDREIARFCNVSNHLIRSVKENVATNKKYVQRSDTKNYTSEQLSNNPEACVEYISIYSDLFKYLLDAYLVILNDQSTNYELSVELTQKLQNILDVHYSKLNITTLNKKGA